MKNIILLLAILVATQITNSQIGIGTTDPDNSAALHLESSTKGFLPPRMTTDQRDAIPSSQGTSEPAEGLVIYNTDYHVPCLEIYNGDGWYNSCCAEAVTKLDDFNFLFRVEPSMSNVTLDTNGKVIGVANSGTGSDFTFQGPVTNEFEFVEDPGTLSYQNKDFLRLALPETNNSNRLQALLPDATGPDNNNYTIFLVARFAQPSSTHSSFFSFTPEGSSGNGAIQIGHGGGGDGCNGSLTLRVGGDSLGICGDAGSTTPADSTDDRVTPDTAFHSYRVTYEQNSPTSVTITFFIDGLRKGSTTRDPGTLGFQLRQLNLFKNRVLNVGSPAEIRALYFIDGVTTAAQNEAIDRGINCRLLD